MNDKEKIRAEIERKKLNSLDKSFTFVPTAMQELLDFIDSLPEENGQTLFEEIAYPGSFKEFIAGLNPPPKIPEMKLEEAVDAEIVKDIHNMLHVKSEALPISTKHRFGDKVRIIIIK